MQYEAKYRTSLLHWNTPSRLHTLGPELTQDFVFRGAGYNSGPGRKREVKYLYMKYVFQVWFRKTEERNKDENKCLTTIYLTIKTVSLSTQYCFESFFQSAYLFF